MSCHKKKCIPNSSALLIILNWIQQTENILLFLKTVLFSFNSSYIFFSLGVRANRRQEEEKPNCKDKNLINVKSNNIFKLYNETYTSVNRKTIVRLSISSQTRVEISILKYVSKTLSSSPLCLGYSPPPLFHVETVNYCFDIILLNVKRPLNQFLAKFITDRNKFVYGK